MEIILLVAIVAVFFLLVLRPARQRQKQFQQVQNTLEPGKRVMLTSGIHGTLVEVDDQTVDIEVAPGTVLTVARPAVAQVFTPLEADDADELEEYDEVEELDEIEPADTDDEKR
ncbi:preprotein translocase subunit YajC [Aeromicrobium sp. YIM 150415]|uniref:preprotein translocase subunit YajC n=1 Tax=Aeromicrobium sp. YIM 150415 TaxID=2803912 RepID=UPI001AA29D7F|nr:preprotein translocase subunit YajC [Aeromicrobium sp. YIM 150415]MBM9464954.1 preprotein translocase subunit YajC [Aeromicrobium sp. YIM 150415]